MSLVECALRSTSIIDFKIIKDILEQHLKSLPFLLLGLDLSKPYQNETLDENIENIRICETMKRQGDYVDYVNPQEVELDIYLFQMNEEKMFDEIDEEEDVTTSHQWILPSKELHGLWDT
jgi:hypothetical protein